jgi:hypothetical protein
LAKIVKVMLEEWHLKWISKVTEDDGTTVPEFFRRAAADLCARLEREESSTVPGPIIAAARASRRGFARGRLRRIAEALGRASETVGGICIKEPIRGQLQSALQDLEVATNLIFDHDVRMPGNPSMTTIPRTPSQWRIAPVRNWTSARRRRLRSRAASSSGRGGPSSAFRATRQRKP